MYQCTGVLSLVFDCLTVDGRNSAAGRKPETWNGRAAPAHGRGAAQQDNHGNRGYEKWRASWSFELSQLVHVVAVFELEKRWEKVFIEIVLLLDLDSERFGNVLLSGQWCRERQVLVASAVAASKFWTPRRADQWSLLVTERYALDSLQALVDHGWPFLVCYEGHQE